jgi:hypothetical protein
MLQEYNHERRYLMKAKTRSTIKRYAKKVGGYAKGITGHNSYFDVDIGMGSGEGMSTDFGMGSSAPRSRSRTVRYVKSSPKRSKSRARTRVVTRYIRSEPRSEGYGWGPSI